VRTRQMLPMLPQHDETRVPVVADPWAQISYLDLPDKLERITFVDRPKTIAASKSQIPLMDIKPRYLGRARAVKLLDSMREDRSGIFSHDCLAEVSVVATCEHSLLAVFLPMDELGPVLGIEPAGEEYQFGFFVRQYQRLQSSRESGGLLVHFRGIYRDNPWNSDFNNTRKWRLPSLRGTHFASFNGRYVPEAILKKVYATAGASMHWIRPKVRVAGRGVGGPGRLDSEGELMMRTARRYIAVGRVIVL
jgi:hypothetical protein